MLRDIGTEDDLEEGGQKSSRHGYVVHVAFLKLIRIRLTGGQNSI